jgi:MFS family permease
VPSPVRSRVAVAYSFALFGFILGAWASRAAEIKQHVGVGKGTYGLLLAAGPVGALAAFAIIRLVIARLGSRRLLLVIGPGCALTPVLFALTTSPWTFAPAFFLNGIFGAALQTPLNANAVLVERRYGRPIMASFHAWFSIGLLFGSLVSAVAARADVDLRLELAVVGGLLVAGFAVSTPFLPADEVPDTERPRRARAISRQLVILGSIAFCSSLGEGAATAWGNIYIRDSLHAGATVGAIAYAFYALCASISRLSSDRLLHRMGRRRFLRTAGLIASAGIATGLALGNVTGGFVTLAAIGIGLAAVIPTIFGAAGNQPGYTPGEGIATVTLLYWPAFLLGPVIIGNLGQATSLRTALFVPVVTAAVLAVLAQWVRNTDDPVEGPVPLEA